MQDETVRIGVEVPREGLRSYSFLGLGYVHNEPVPDRRSAWPVGRGVPLPEGAVSDVSALRLLDARGVAVPVQARELARWRDGSIMFAHLAWQCDVAHDAPAEFELRLDGTGEAPMPDAPVTVEQDEGGVTLDNGLLRVEVGSEEGRPTLRVTVGGATAFDGPLALWTRDAEGRRFTGALGDLRVVEPGPLTAAIELSGRHQDEAGGAFLDYTLRLRLNAGRPELHLAHAFLNLGDEEEGVAVGEIGLGLPSAGREVSHVVAQLASGMTSFPRLCEVPEDVEINVGRTGARIADLDSLREDTSQYPPYLMKNRDLVEPYVGLRGQGWSAVAFLRECQQNHPKRLRACGGGLEFHMWPDGAELPALRQGMARTHEAVIAFLPPDAPAVDMHRTFYQWESPATVTVPFEWYRRCEVFGMQYVMPWLPRRYRRIEANLASTIERAWVSGMFAYGDDPDSGYTGSYAQIGLGDSTVWINNEHDFTSQAVIQFWRSNRPKAWLSARVCAQHQIDVDFVRCGNDPWKVGGIPAHCHGHTTASVYPSHTWTEGLLQYYVTSGDGRALEVARSLGRNLCKYIEERIEPLRSETRMFGWALIALDALIEVTHDDRCLRAARTIRDEIAEVVERTGTLDGWGMNYGTGTVLTGLAGLHRITGDEKALKLLLTILDWHMEHGRNAVGTAWGDQLGPYNLNLTLPAYAYAWYATGDRRYLEEGIDFFRFTGPPAAAGRDVRSAGKHYRTYMPFLKLAHEAGALREMEDRMM